MDCEHCGKTFAKRTPHQRFCHWRCRTACRRSGAWQRKELPLHPFVQLYNEGHRVVDIAHLHETTPQYVSSVIVRARKRGRTRDAPSWGGESGNEPLLSRP